MTLQNVVSGYYQGYTVSYLERLILWELGQVSGTTVSYNKFPQWLIRQKLTDRQNIFVFKSRCITKMALIKAKEGYREYKLPINCMDKGLISLRYYIDSDTYKDIELRDKKYLDENYPGWLTADNGTPQIAYMGDSYGNIPMFGVYPAPDENGTDYTLSPDTGVVIGGDLPTTISNYAGMATGGSATTLDDTSVDFTTYGLVAGQTVNNVTDGSTASISSVAATELTITTLTGGTNNTFSSGDSYEILTGEYGVVTSWEDDDQYIFGSEIGLVSQITLPAGNFRAEFIPYPMPFSYDTDVSDGAQNVDLMYPEIPKLYHQALAHGVIADLLMTFHENSKEFSRAEKYEEKFNNAISEATMAKNTRPYVKQQVYFTSGSRRRR